MKKFITLLLSFILILTASVPPVFADEFYTSSNDQILTVAEFERLFPSDYTYSTYYEDATGNNGYIKFDIINNKTYVELYINNILSQRAYSSPDENIIRWIEYDAQSRSSNSALIQSCLYSDMITDITFQNVENNSYELYSSIFSKTYPSLKGFKSNNSFLSNIFSQYTQVYYIVNLFNFQYNL